MKITKLTIAMFAIVFIAAGCNSSNPSSNIEEKSIVSPSPSPKISPIPTPTPKPQSSCDSNYSGCVPIASDVDCAGGSGNGPAYVRGPIYVTGSDIYDLDRDRDGIACE